MVSGIIFFVCPAIFIGPEKETMRFVFEFRKRSRNTRKDVRRDTGRSSVLETKRSGTENQSTLLKESEIQEASQMAQRFKETGQPVSTSASALSRGLLRSLNGKETSVRDHSIHKGFRIRIVLVPGIGWCEPEDQT